MSISVQGQIVPKASSRFQSALSVIYGGTNNAYGSRVSDVKLFKKPSNQTT